MVKGNSPDSTGFAFLGHNCNKSPFKAQKKDQANKNPFFHLFINTLQKRAKKTNFFADPNPVSRHGGILGCGYRPLFGK